MLIRCLLLLLIAAAPVVPQSPEFKKLIKDTSTEGSPPKTALKLSNPLIGDNGRIYACSGRNLFAFESNGTVAWIIPLKYLCSVDIVPVDDGRGKIYLVAEGRVLKVTPSNIGTSISTVEIFFGPNSTIGGSGEIIGISVSIWYASLFVCIKNRGLFAFLFNGRLLWSVGPMLYRFGFRQGCKKDITGCYFISSPIVDQCEGTLYMENMNFKQSKKKTPYKVSSEKTCSEMTDAKSYEPSPPRPSKAPLGIGLPAKVKQR